MSLAPNIVVDVEADGPCPGLYSMVSFGAAVRVGDKIETFYSGVIKPLNGARYNAEALAVSGISREEQLKGGDPQAAMLAFNLWLDTYFPGQSRFVFWSDNPGFDWQFFNYYWHGFMGSKNPFGFSSRRIGDFVAGLERDIRKTNDWKKLRKTKHDHNPANDAKGNLEAFLAIRAKHRI